MTPPTPSPWLTIHEAAAVMRVGHNTLRCLVNEGRIPHRKVGRRVHLRWDVCVAYEGEAEYLTDTDRAPNVRSPAT